MEMEPLFSVAFLLGAFSSAGANIGNEIDLSEHEMFSKLSVLMDAFQKLEKSSHEQQKTIQRLELTVAQQKKDMIIQKQIFEDRCSDINQIKALLHQRGILSVNNTEDVNHINRHVRESANAENISFYAYLTQSIDNPVADHDIHFDTVVNNNGDGYKASSGTFIVPAGGVYVFMWSITGRGNVPIQLTVNGVVRGRLDTYTGSHDATNTASGFVVLNVNAGDVVLMRTHPTFSPTGQIRSDEWIQSGFGGWKLD